LNIFKLISKANIQFSTKKPLRFFAKTLHSLRLKKLTAKKRKEGIAKDRKANK